MKDGSLVLAQRLQGELYRAYRREPPAAPVAAAHAGGPVGLRTHASVIENRYVGSLDQESYIMSSISWVLRGEGWVTYMWSIAIESLAQVGGKSIQPRSEMREWERGLLLLDTYLRDGSAYRSPLRWYQ